MNEYIEVTLRRKQKALRIARQLPGGIELDEPDPIARTVSVGFDAADDITDYRLRRVRQLRGWDPGQFSLHCTVEEGRLILRGVDENGLPGGRYTVTLRLAEAKTTQKSRRVEIEDDDHGTLTVDVTTDDRDVEVDLEECDGEIKRVLDASRFDGVVGEDWLAGDSRAGKKACLLNLLASLRVRPTKAAPLIEHVQYFFVMLGERGYARVDAGFLTRLQELAADPKKPFYAEGRPVDDMHKALVDAIPADVRPLFSADRLLSFRGEGSPSLQAVVAEPPPGADYTFADIDLDLGNALQDVVGFVVHMGELASGDPTNHLDLRRKLAKTTAREFLYYKVV